MHGLVTVGLIMAPVIIPNCFQVIYVTNIYATRFELSIYSFLPVQNVE